MQKSIEFDALDRFFAKRILKQNSLEESALFLSTLMHMSREGHLCWKFSSPPFLPEGVVQEGVDIYPTAPVVRDGDRFYLNRNWIYETYILEEVKRLKRLKPSCHNVEIFNQRLQKSPLNSEQKEAVQKAFQSSFSLICGGPGTGKTYTAGTFIQLLLASKTKDKYKVCLSAPTGKAASHLESTLLQLGNIDATLETSTLHRLLRVTPGENKLFSSRKIDADLVVVDEASMLDVPLLARLLESIGDETRLVLMGDPDQLPPVEAGSLFSDMAESLATFLKTSMRTDVAHLHTLAKEINQGNWPTFNHESTKLHSWGFDRNLTGALFDAIDPFISSDEPSPEFLFNKLKEFRVLGSLRQGPFGIDALNRSLVSEMGRRIHTGQFWSVPIMIKSNEPRLDLYNGSCGILISQSEGGVDFSKAMAYFPNLSAPLRVKMLPSFEVAFCLSIHKSQGSEFEKVLALFPAGSENFGREALYTAVTRAKKSVEIVGEEMTLRAMLEQRSRRVSGFLDRFSAAGK